MPDGPTSARPLVVAALGGNALLRRGEPLDHDHQEHNVELAATVLAGVLPSARLVVTHGSGPQVGLLALQVSAYAEDTDTPEWPLHVLNAEIAGMVGYLLEEALANACAGTLVATLLTRTVVDADDPAFAAPTKPIGPVYGDEATARDVAGRNGWAVARDGTGWRRVVASPEPVDLTGVDAVRLLSGANALVIAAGGGGVPVARGADGLLHGVEAIVDKDLVSAVLATRLQADALVLLTDVAAVVENWGTDAARPLRDMPVAWARSAGFAAGSMGPKVEAACRFAEATGRPAVIGALGDAVALASGDAGTRILPGDGSPTYWDAAGATLTHQGESS